jgi:hypothetical protein
MGVDSLKSRLFSLWGGGGGGTRYLINKKLGGQDSTSEVFSAEKKKRVMPLSGIEPWFIALPVLEYNGYASIVTRIICVDYRCTKYLMRKNKISCINPRRWVKIKLPSYNAFQGFPTITPTNAEEFNLVRTRVILGDLTHQRTAWPESGRNVFAIRSEMWIIFRT